MIYKLKLMYLADSEAPHTRRWANWFAEQGHEVHVVSFNDKVDHGYEKVIIHNLWKFKFSNKNLLIRFVKSIYLLIRILFLYFRLKPNVVHSHSVGAYAWSSTILNLRPRILTPWGTDILIDIHKSKINYFFTKMSLKTSDLITTDAKYFFKELKKLNINEKKIIYIPFGTDTNKFKPVEKESEKYRISIISTRTLNPVHSVSTLIDAIPNVLETYKNIEFIIVGDGTERQKLMDKSRALNITNYVQFIGMVNEITLIKLLQKSDFYISTSPLDAGLAASTAEAMACALPIIQTESADNREWSDSNGVFLFESGNSIQLSELILNLVEKKSEWINMGKRNRQIILDGNDMNKFMTKMLEFYTIL